MKIKDINKESKSNFKRKENWFPVDLHGNTSCKTWACIFSRKMIFFTTEINKKLKLKVISRRK
jgi:hypothetical protein